MKEQLKRDLNKTYLILSSGEKQYEESYETEMIMKNAPGTLLPLHVLRVDGEVQLFYDVSAKQTLKDCAVRVKLSGKIIRDLFKAIDQMIGEMKNYLLDMESVLLDLQHIYTKEGGFFFCYCPWEKREVLASLRNMLEEILGNLDYHDTEGVELAYHLYQSACRGDFHIIKILEEHEKEEVKAPEEIHSEVRIFLETDKFVQEELIVSDHKSSNCSEEKKPGLLRRLVQFFMKKQVSEEEMEKETYQTREVEVFSDYEPALGYTQVLEPSDTNTILLENMPAGRWKLRPLLPGYEEFCITGEHFLVGKKKDEVDGYIGRETISRIHSRLSVRQDRLFLSDANSTNGTFVNELTIEPGKEVEIFAGDRILFADVGYECYNSL
mgnify:CR=1 FL=1